MMNWRITVGVIVGMFIHLQSIASHIVGGEFELIHEYENSYRLNLNLYFDVKEGEAGARDPGLNAAIYRKSDNQLMSIVRLNHTSTSRVKYFQISCSSGEVVTDKITYSTTLALDPSIYNDPGGYYIAWERCCRNYTIDNIFSSNTETNLVDYAGQTYYLEFPAVVKDGQPFINSSPILFPPLNDYACPGTDYWVNFEGTDPDGDSLVYTIVTPLSTHKPQPLADNNSAGPAPYPEVRWRTDLGFSFENIMKGNPDLQISTNGFLTVTPTIEGLFVFAVKVEEFRDDIKIGEVRRDFQLLVVDKCTKSEPPVIKGKNLNDANFIYSRNMNASFNKSTTDDQRCIEVQITDPDALKFEENFTEKVWLHAFPIGFRDDVSEVLPENIYATLINGSDATFEICFPSCPYVESGFYTIGIVAFDDACTLPYSDTLKVNVFVEVPDNQSPYFVDGNEWEITVEKAADGYFTRKFLARDDDNHNLTLQIDPQEMDPYNGIYLYESQNTPGEVEIDLQWYYDCRSYEFDTTSYSFLLSVTDEGNCFSSSEDSLRITLNIEDLPNTIPNVNVSLNSDGDGYHFVEQAINEILSFEVNASDEDMDNILLYGAGLNFGFHSYDITFNPVYGNGKPGISSDFSWQLPCDFKLHIQDSFNLQFYVKDEHYCKNSNIDTVQVDIKLVPTSSRKPTLNAFASGNTSIIGNKVITTVGEPIELRLFGADSDKDNLLLSLNNLNELMNAEFTTASGNAQVSSNFYWQTDCNIFQGDVKDSVAFTGDFIIVDDNCYEVETDTLSVDFIIYDLNSLEGQFDAPNVITPNDDGENDYFVLEDIFRVDGSRRGMPRDNCAGQFMNFEIYNRWGGLIFESDQRDFQWHPGSKSPGIYYYYLKYTDKSYKGYINVIF